MTKTTVSKSILSAAAALLVAAPALAVDVKIGGYVKLDALWTNKIVDNGVGVVGTPVDDATKDHSSFLMEARETRFNLTGTEEVDGVKLKGFIEGDFYGSGNTFRLRHAYAKATLPSGLSFLAGQYWSNFQDTETGAPETIDFNGCAGQLFARNAQFRVTYDLPDAKTQLSASVEQNKLSVTDAFNLAGPDSSTQALPLFTAKAVVSPGPVTIEASGVVSKNRAILGDREDSSTESETAWGAGATVAGNAGPLRLVAHIQRLNGVNVLGNGDFADAEISVDDEESIENIKTTGWYAGATYTLNTTVFNVVYGWEKASGSDEELAEAGSAQTMQSFHVNVLQPLWKSMKVGLEYQWYKKKYNYDFDVDGDPVEGDGASGTYQRVQAGFWYYF